MIELINIKYFCKHINNTILVVNPKTYKAYTSHSNYEITFTKGMIGLINRCRSMRTFTSNVIWTTITVLSVVERDIDM
jgi:hypothetical protein